MDKEDVWYKDILQVNKQPALNKIQDKNSITLKILKTLRKMSLF